MHPYINHITITTGHNARTSRADVDDATLAIVAPWLKNIINTDTPHPLPVEPLSHFSAIAFVREGGLLVTVYGPSGPHLHGAPAHGAGIPLVTFGVAQKSRHGEPLWAMMTASFPHQPSIKQPRTPWCAVAVHPSIMAHPAAMEWLGDFERCCAWAWITRNTQFEEI